MTGLSHPLGMYFLFVGTQLLQGDDPGQLWVLYVFREETLTGQERRPELLLPGQPWLVAALTWSVVAGGGRAGEWEIMRREASSCWGGKKKLGTTIGSGLQW